jgi:hypothetical protein
MKAKPFSMLSLLMLLSTTTLISQTTDNPSAFISANLGGFITAYEGFSKVYDSNIGFAFGAGLGLPLTNRLYIYGKATYFAKKGVPVVSTYNFQNGNLVSITETKDGSASYKQWIFNGGLQYNLALSNEFNLGINGGITYTRITEEKKSSNVSSSLNTSGVLGFFGGVGIEKKFQESPFAVFAESQYNYSRKDIIAAVGNYGGLNMSLGLRYFFRFEHK